MTWIADVSYGHDAAPGAKLAAAGCVGVIGYAGCDDTGKNCSRANVADWRAHGLMVGLVIENGAQDMAQGAATGARLGRNIMAAAKTIGYDTANCVLYTAADWNSQSTAELRGIDAAMQAFAAVVPHPGLYGNSYAIDQVIVGGHAEHGWQSNSTSFSNGPSTHANLLQRFNDPRAHGLPVDVSDIQHAPIGLMGEDMALDPNDPVIVALNGRLNDVMARIQAIGQVEIWGDPTHPDSIHSIGRNVAAIQAALTKLQATVTALPQTAAGMTPAEIAQHLTITSN